MGFTLGMREEEYRLVPDFWLCTRALEHWLNLPNTHFFCDTYAAAGSVAEGFFARENVRCPGSSAGRTKQAFVLLSEKVLANIETALAE